MSVNFELYRIFYTVVKNGSITNAAKELFISQPAVSQSIKQLESQLGGSLFSRTPKGMELTKEGLAIYDYIKRANNLMEQAEQKFYQYKSLSLGTIRIGASDNICRNFLLPFIMEFKAAYPEIKVKLFNGTSAQTLNLIKTGSVDLGFVNLPVDDNEVEAVPCGKLHDCFVGGTSYYVLKDKHLTVRELLAYPIILISEGTNSRRFIDEYFRGFGEVCKPDIEVGSHDLLIAFAKNNMGISCVTEEFVCRELESGKLIKLNIEGDVRSRDIGYIKLKNFNDPFAVQKLLELMGKRLNKRFIY